MIKKMIKSVVPKGLNDDTKNDNSHLFRMSTSISDDQIYPDFCAKASISSELFQNFRRNEIYNIVLEHVTESQGTSYINEIEKTFPNYLEHINKFKENDYWGNPQVFEYPGIGKISPSTLRYIKVYADIRYLFGNLDNLKICEIGVGYGGQCRIINSTEKPAEYTLVDIKQALLLTQRYLDNYIMNSRLRYITMNELEKQEYDLFISNYAFTELPGKIQDVYLNKVVLNCSKGYITYNDTSPEHFKSYTKEELLNIIPGSEIIEEKPLTHKKNCIIIWGHKGSSNS